MPATVAMAATMLPRGEADQSHVLCIPSSSSLLFEDEKNMEEKPFLPRALSYTKNNANNNNQQQRRRRVASETSLPSLSLRHHSSSPDAAHAAADTYFVTRLGCKLVRSLRLLMRNISLNSPFETVCFLEKIPGSNKDVYEGKSGKMENLYKTSVLEIVVCRMSVLDVTDNLVCNMKWLLSLCWGFFILYAKSLKPFGILFLGGRTEILERFTDMIDEITHLQLLGYRWIKRFLALGCYSILIMPGFFQVAYYYFSSSQVRRGVVYGDQPRNKLDLYLPINNDGPKPVVAFVTGGAWIIGYKAWGSLLGQQLAERDIIVACIDYRNFPQGSISDMVKDASQGISFVCNNIAEYGGDPNRIYLMGQSAGAHIAACALLEQAIKESGEGESTFWSLSQIKAYFGLSGGSGSFSSGYGVGPECAYGKVDLAIKGEVVLLKLSPETYWGFCLILWKPLLPEGVEVLSYPCVLGPLRYNLFSLVDHFHSRGLYRSLFLSIMEGEQSLGRFSPEVMVQDPSIRHAVSLLPPIILFHGTGDYSIPSDASKTFADALHRVGAQAEVILYEGKTHTDVFLQITFNRESIVAFALLFKVGKLCYVLKEGMVQDPMRGGSDDLFEDLLAFIHAGDTEALAKDASAPLRRRLVPEFMLKLAHKVSPF
ncbi:hypothetical protein HHK36_015065 [Tetracentron sinense]|uniref:protein-S-isoprenylcysteine alpha-carbonyl methylesterase n=1 Tax=Tetracentron sinense TaxID=13715 RepID=A0A834Z2D6_TETSI|nr:hypothetical protein HHK36_015065 [Tetracentron sinense]